MLGADLVELGNRLDEIRKKRLAEHDFLTMTGLYNVLERERELENGCDVPPLSPKERDVHEAGLVSLLKEVHDDIDRAVARCLWLARPDSRADRQARGHCALAVQVVPAGGSRRGNAAPADRP